MRVIHWLRGVPALLITPGVGLLIVLSAPSVKALEADQIVLVVNAKVPAGARLANFYCEQRHIPPRRILTLDLPDGDDISSAEYDSRVVPELRRFLVDNALDRKIKCVVTCYGVPLRVDRRPLTQGDKHELEQLDNELKGIRDQVGAVVLGMESLAKEMDASFKPVTTEDDLLTFPGRVDAAVTSVLRSLAGEKSGDRRSKKFAELVQLVGVLAGPLETQLRLTQPEYSQFADKPQTSEQSEKRDRRFHQDEDELRTLQTRPYDSDTRSRIREIFRNDLGLFRSLNVVGEQRARLDASESEAAFDNELALAWWPQIYMRHRWLDNPIYYRYESGRRHPRTPPVLMVTRLDGPTEQSVHDLIATGIRVEREGLHGQVVLDARGKPAGDPYGIYDQTIRNLANLLVAHTSLKVTLDDAEPLFPSHSQKDVAIYCGWYSLHRYVPCCSFNPGAVGFHIASSELLDLHNPGETGWVRGLMNDGVVGTLGPVAEPYLHSFPRADEFFPLVLTGKMPMAEVYWKTTPLVSWMQAYVGDPLYTPYQADAPLKVDDVPPALRAAFEPTRTLWLPPDLTVPTGAEAPSSR